MQEFEYIVTCKEILKRFFTISVIWNIKVLNFTIDNNYLVFKKKDLTIRFYFETTIAIFLHVTCVLIELTNNKISSGAVAYF